MLNTLERSLALLKPGARNLAKTDTELKNRVLLKFADGLQNQSEFILEMNRKDLEHLARAEKNENKTFTSAFRDRLTLDKARVLEMADAVRSIAKLPDPVGELLESKTLDNGLKLRRIRSPLGAILVIFESRPNVIAEIFALTFKSGNAVALRGGSDSKETAHALYGIIRGLLEDEFLDADNDPSTQIPCPFVGIEDYDRDLVGRLLLRSDVFDVCIPRGGSELIERVVRESKMPVIKNDKGVCHLYVHSKANLEMAVKIVINAKTSRPGVCNALETLLVDEEIARPLFERLMPELARKNVELNACEKSFALLRAIAKTDQVESFWIKNLTAAEDDDFYREYLDLKLNVKIVSGPSFAISHIGKYGSDHSDAIVTDDEPTARHFQNDVDSACVYWNASTRFTDGHSMGLGGEIGISTQKLHVRGPVGLKELTSSRWWIDGTGQIRE